MQALPYQIFKRCGHYIVIDIRTKEICSYPDSYATVKRMAATLNKAFKELSA
jgi:hypothetical protein